MKKIIIALFLSLSLSSTLFAQTAQDSISKIKTEKKEVYRGFDLNAHFQENMGSAEWGIDAIKLWHFSLNWDHANFSYGMKSNSWTFGAGWNIRKVIKNCFLIQGRLFPYAGVLKTKFEDEELGNSSEFTYGARANAQIGFKIYDAKDEVKHKAFLTIGYRIDAPEFKTKDMFKNGWWGIGISFVEIPL